MGAFFFAAESEPHLHDLLFPFAQFGDGGKEHLPLCLVLDVPAHDVLVCPQDVGEQQLVAVPVGRKRLVDGDLATELGIFPQHHKDFVFDAPGGVCRQLDLLVRTEGLHCLDETDGADGDEILQPQPGGFELFGNVDHQAQIVDDKGLPCGGVALVQPGKNRLFLLFGERRRKGIRTIDVVHPAERRKFSPQLGEQQAEFPENGLHEKDSFHSSSCG